MKKTCGAKTRSGGKCKKSPMPNGRCRLHGGVVPRGPAHHSYKTGKYSKYLKGGIAKKYAEAMENGGRLSLLDDIALTDARMAELMDSMGGTNLPELWLKMNAIRERAESGRVNKANAIRDIMAIIQEGAADARRWQDVTTLQDHKRKLIDTENKAAAIAERMISADEFMAYIHRLVGIITEHVSNKRTLSAITSGIERTILGRGNEGASA